MKKLVKNNFHFLASKGGQNSLLMHVPLFSLFESGHFTQVLLKGLKRFAENEVVQATLQRALTNKLTRRQSSDFKRQQLATHLVLLL